MIEPGQLYTSEKEWALDTAANSAKLEVINEQGRLVVADIDGVLLDSDLQWYNDYRRLATNEGVPEQELSTLKAFRESPRSCFAAMGWDGEYTRYKAQRIEDNEFHKRMPPVADAEILAGLGSLGLPGAYLSTRPEIVAEATLTNLSIYGFTPNPVLLRSKDIPYDDTIKFKKRALTTLSTAVQSYLPGTVITVVDDYKTLVDEINDIGNPYLHAVHFGPHHTWRKILKNLLLQ
jgi:hypothetical protein